MGRVFQPANETEFLANARNPATERTVFSRDRERGEKMRYVIIGNSAAGIAAAGSIIARDKAGTVTILSDEPHPSYYRPLITSIIENGHGLQSLLRDQAAVPQNLETRLGIRVRAIQPELKSLTLDRGETVEYDRLFIATGSSAAFLPIPWLSGPGVSVVRTIADAEAIKADAQSANRAVVIGGGRVGIKTALALRKRGLAVTVVELGDRVVPVQFDEPAAEIVGRAVEAQGIRLVLGQSVQEVQRLNGKVTGVRLNDGTSLDADLVIVAVGIKPNAQLAAEAGLDVKRGVVVNDLMQTSDPDIFAGGDVAETRDIVTGESIIAGTWTDAVGMGRVAGTNMAGGHATHAGSLAVQNAFEPAGVPTVSVGLIDPPDTGEYRVYTESRGDTYRKLVTRGDRLVGALMVGNVERAGVYTGLIKRRANVGTHLDSLLRYQPSLSPFLVHDLTVNRCVQ